MARINMQDVKEYSLDELKSRIAQEQADYRDKRFAHAISPIENPLLLKDLRRNVARLKSELRRRELQETNK